MEEQAQKNDFIDLYRRYHYGSLSEKHAASCR